MDNTEKLLRAFIETQGYDIEEIYEESLPSGQITIPHDYKVIKKEPTQQEKASFDMSELISHSEAWCAICDYVLEHKDDIGYSINDFGTLKPVLEFFYRNSKPFTYEDFKCGIL